MTGSTRELRLALGMRGGVSLAVWIGGACAEIDKLRRSTGSATAEEAASTFWNDVRGISEYGAVVVDVLAGASAGGLNGALYAPSIVYDFPYDNMRDLWLDAGGTDTLLRSAHPFMSLFDGDGVFLRDAYDYLTGSALPGDGTDASGVPERVALSLSATLLEPIERLGTSPADEQQWESRSAGGFHFEHHAETWRGTDFTPGSATDPDPRRRALARLALAARSTSSFPVAFEPAIVHAGRGKTFASAAVTTSHEAEPADAALPGRVDLDGTFLDRRADGTFLVADGGILDNIPLARAIRDIVSAPAGGPTHRALLYLQPGAPSHHAKATPVAPEKRRAIRALAGGVVRAFRTEETISQDIEALESHTEAVNRARAMRGATFARLTHADGTPRQRLEAAATSALSSYCQQRGAEDALATSALLCDPLATLAHDPFPASVAGELVSDDSWRSPLGNCSPGERTALAGALWDAFDETAKSDRIDVDLLRIGVGPVQRVARVLLDWTWYLEKEGAEVGTCKRSLYRIVNFADTLLEAPLQWTWVAAAARAMNPKCSVESATFVGQCMQWTNELCRMDSDADGNELRDALLGGTGAPIVAFRDRTLGRIDGVVANILDGNMAAPPVLSPDDDVRTVLLQVLVEIAQQLRGQTPGSSPDGAFHSGRVLDEYLGGDEEIDESTLGALEVLCYPEFVAGAPCQSAIEFYRLSAANRFVIASEFSTLLAAAHELNKWWDPNHPSPAPQRGIHVDLKLAGNDLSNFSAFLLPEWRANDWLWGRLDAVPTLVDLLVTPSSLRAHNIEGKAKIAAVRELAVPSTPGDVQSQMTAFFEPRASDIEDELEALADHTQLEPGIQTIRDVLIARREWEILSEELRKLRRPASAPDRPGTRPLVRDAADGQPAISLANAVGAYDAGAQTTRTPEGPEQDGDRALALRSRFDELVDRGAEVVLDNLDQAQGGPLPVASLSDRSRNLVLGGLRLAGGFVTRRLLPKTPSDHPARRWILLVLGVAILVAAVVYAFSRDIAAFAIGFAVPIVILVVLLVLLWRAGKRKPSAQRHPT